MNKNQYKNTDFKRSVFIVFSLSFHCLFINDCLKNDKKTMKKQRNLKKIIYVWHIFLKIKDNEKTMKIFIDILYIWHILILMIKL